MDILALSRNNGGALAATAVTVAEQRRRTFKNRGRSNGGDSSSGNGSGTGGTASLLSSPLSLTDTDVNFNNSPGHRSSLDGSFIQDDDSRLILELGIQHTVISPLKSNMMDYSSVSSNKTPTAIAATNMITESWRGRQAKLASDFDANVVAQLDFDEFRHSDIRNLMRRSSLSLNNGRIGTAAGGQQVDENKKYTVEEVIEATAVVDGTGKLTGFVPQKSIDRSRLSLSNSKIDLNSSSPLFTSFLDEVGATESQQQQQFAEHSQNIDQSSSEKFYSLKRADSRKQQRRKPLQHNNGILASSTLANSLSRDISDDEEGALRAERERADFDVDEERIEQNGEDNDDDEEYDDESRREKALNDFCRTKKLDYVLTFNNTITESGVQLTSSSDEDEECEESDDPDLDDFYDDQNEKYLSYSDFYPDQPDFYGFPPRRYGNGGGFHDRFDLFGVSSLKFNNKNASTNTAGNNNKFANACDLYYNRCSSLPDLNYLLHKRRRRRRYRRRVLSHNLRSVKLPSYFPAADPGDTTGTGSSRNQKKPVCFYRVDDELFLRRFKNNDDNIYHKNFTTNNLSSGYATVPNSQNAINKQIVIEATATNAEPVITGLQPVLPEPKPVFPIQKPVQSSFITTAIDRDYSEFYLNGKYIDVNHNELNNHVTTQQPNLHNNININGDKDQRNNDIRNFERKLTFFNDKTFFNDTVNRITPALSSTFSYKSNQNVKATTISANTATLKNSATQIPVYVSNKGAQTVDGYFSTNTVNLQSSKSGRQHSLFEPYKNYSDENKNFSRLSMNLDFMALPFEVPRLFPHVRKFPQSFLLNDNTQQQQQQLLSETKLEETVNTTPVNMNATPVNAHHPCNAKTMFDFLQTKSSSKNFNADFLELASAKPFMINKNFSINAVDEIFVPDPPTTTPIQFRKKQLPSVLRESTTVAGNPAGFAEQNNVLIVAATDSSMINRRDSGLGGSCSGAGTGTATTNGGTGGPSHIQDWDSLATLLPRPVAQTCSFFKANQNLLVGGLAGAGKMGDIYSNNKQQQSNNCCNSRDHVTIDVCHNGVTKAEDDHHCCSDVLTAPQRCLPNVSRQSCCSHGGDIKIRIECCCSCSKIRHQSLHRKKSGDTHHHHCCCSSNGHVCNPGGFKNRQRQGQRSRQLSCEGQRSFCQGQRSSYQDQSSYPCCRYCSGCSRLKPDKTGSRKKVKDHHNRKYGGHCRECRRVGGANNVNLSADEDDVEELDVHQGICYEEASEDDSVSQSETEDYDDDDDECERLAGNHVTVTRSSHSARVTSSPSGRRRPSMSRSSTASRRFHSLQDAKQFYDHHSFHPLTAKNKNNTKFRAGLNEISSLANHNGGVVTMATNDDDDERSPLAEDQVTPCATCFRVRSASSSLDAQHSGPLLSPIGPENVSGDEFCDCRTSDIIEYNNGTTTHRGEQAATTYKRRSCFFPGHSVVEKTIKSLNDEEKAAQQTSIYIRKQDLVNRTTKICDELLTYVSSKPENVIRMESNADCYVINLLSTCIENVVDDGLLPRRNVWTIVRASATLGPATKSIHELVTDLNSEYTKTNLMSNEECSRKFQMFVVGLLKLRSLDCWLSYLVLKDKILLENYAESAFLRKATSAYKTLFNRLVMALQPLSMLKFPSSTYTGDSTTYSIINNMRNNVRKDSETEKILRTLQDTTEIALRNFEDEPRLVFYNSCTPDSDVFQSKPAQLPSDSRIPKSSSVPSKLVTCYYTTSEITMTSRRDRKSPSHSLDGNFKFAATRETAAMDEENLHKSINTSSASRIPVLKTSRSYPPCYNQQIKKRPDSLKFSSTSASHVMSRDFQFSSANRLRSPFPTIATTSEEDESVMSMDASIFEEDSEDSVGRNGHMTEENSIDIAYGTTKTLRYLSAIENVSSPRQGFLPFSKGDTLLLLDDYGNGFLRCRRGGRIGLVDRNTVTYVTCL